MASRLEQLQDAAAKLRKKAAECGEDTARRERLEQRLAEYKQSIQQLMDGKPEYDVPEHADLPVGARVNT